METGYHSEIPNVDQNGNPISTQQDHANDSNKPNTLETSPKQYLNIFSDFPTYCVQRRNLLSLKACSIFEKNKLLENDYLDVLCETKKMTTRNSWEVNLALTFIPKKKGLNISTRLITYDSIEAFPNFINDFPFDNAVGQTFSYKMIGLFRPLNFAGLSLSLTTAQSKATVFNIKVPLPFSINKFVSVRQTSHENLIHYVRDSVEVKAIEFEADPDYITNGHDLTEILNGLLVFDESVFCLFLDFGGDLTCALKLELLSRLVLRATVYSQTPNPIFVEYLNWFLWMFSQKAIDRS